MADETLAQQHATLSEIEIILTSVELTLQLADEALARQRATRSEIDIILMGVELTLQWAKASIYVESQHATHSEIGATALETVELTQRRIAELEAEVRTWIRENQNNTLSEPGGVAAMELAEGPRPEPGAGAAAELVGRLGVVGDGLGPQHGMYCGPPRESSTRR